jgi:hypothetical protein
MKLPFGKTLIIYSLSVLIVGTFLFLFLENSFDNNYLLINSNPTPKKKLALVVSVSTFHYEVSIFFAWQLQKLGYEVRFWTVPPKLFSGYFDNSAMDKVASRTEYIYENLPFFKRIPKSEITVFITGVREIKYFKEKGVLNKMISNTNRMFMVNHHYDEAVKVAEYCRIDNHCTIMHLAKHLDTESKKFLQRSNITTSSTTYVYPVFNVSEVYPSIKTIPKNPKDPLKLTIQGNAQNKRRNYDGLFTNLEREKEITPWKLNILGHGASTMDIPNVLIPHVKKFDDVPFDKFYSVIKNSDFLLAFLQPDYHYDTNRATSSVPAAIMCQVPILLTQKFLNIYDCLAKSPIHQKVSKYSDADGLAAVMKLSVRELILARKEAEHCFVEWTTQNAEVIRQIMIPPTTTNPLTSL